MKIYLVSQKYYKIFQESINYDLHTIVSPLYKEKKLQNVKNPIIPNTGLVSATLKSIMYNMTDNTKRFLLSYADPEDMELFATVINQLKNVYGKDIEFVEVPYVDIMIHLQRFVRSYYVNAHYTLNAIAIVDEETLSIGNDKEQPFYIKEDLKHFKELTAKSTCIVGYNTWISMPIKTLPNRNLIVISSKAKELQTQYTNLENVYFVSSIIDAIEKFHDLKYYTGFVIGGEQIYKQMLPLCTKIYLTLVDIGGLKDRFGTLDKKFPIKKNLCEFDNKIYPYIGCKEITCTSPKRIDEYMLYNKICHEPIFIKFQELKYDFKLTLPEEMR